MQEPESDMKEHRRVKRRQPYCSLQVYDGISSRIIGHVADLTHRGVMLVCKEPVGIREEHRLRIKFPVLVGSREEFNVRAVCRWCREDANLEMFVAGFQFQELSSEENQFITYLIDDLSFQG